MSKAIAVCVLVLCAAGGAFADPLTPPSPPASSAPESAPAPSQAADQALPQPVIGPAPSWVTPIAIPPAPAETGDAPLLFLLGDQQVSFETGSQTTYTEWAVKVETPQGLARAGNISLPWRPDTDVLTVHKLRIRRGDQVIDVLASGQKFTVLRREQNLENAVLDGVLTANLQVEGVQLGDVIEFAASVTTRDPVLAGQVEDVGAAWMVPIARAHLSVQWPESMHIAQRVTAALPPGRVIHRDGKVVFDLSQDNVQPIAPPNGAPTRFAFPRLAEFTSFTSWADVAALLAPLFDHAATAPNTGPLASEIARIRGLSPDPLVRAQAALTLVQDHIRYVALAMGEGGLVPADAETTWERRFGDCKGKTALLLAFLHALDIQATAVAVNASWGDGLDQHVPMVHAFDHVLVRATIGGRDYWLDGTRSGDTHLDQLETPNFSWGLPLVAENAALVRMLPPPLERPREIMSTRIDASAGLMAPAPVHAELLLRGDEAVAINMAYANFSRDQRDSMLREYWRRIFNNVDIASTSVAFDPDAREERYVMDGRLHMNWDRGGYQADVDPVGYRADFNREPGPNSDAPFAVDYPFYRQTSETIVLPEERGFRIQDGDDVDQTIAGVAFHRHAAISGNTFTVEVSARSVAPEFPASEAPAAQTALNALAGRAVYLLKPQNYQFTAGDVALAAAATPSDAAGFERRANMYLNLDRLDESIADDTSALALDPRNAQALADRGMAYAIRGQTAEATHDLDAAAAINPAIVGIYRARGALAQRAGALTDAIAAYSQALAISSRDMYALVHRAYAYRAAGDDTHALADMQTAMEVEPQSPDPYLLRASIFMSRSDPAQAAAEGDRLASAAPDDVQAHVVAARIFAMANQTDKATREFDRALAIRPLASTYVERASSRPASDVDGRLADLEAALRLEPQNVDALAFKAELLQSRRDYRGAVSALSLAIHAAPNNVHLLSDRGVNYALLSRPAQANADFAAARAHAQSADDLNDLCWTKATAGVALDSALSDCDLALQRAPNDAAVLDSRAFVLLRLGRLDDAISAYDQALAVAPRQAESLYGRGIAWGRKGDQAKAAADLAAATQIESDVGVEFAGYGVSPAPAQ